MSYSITEVELREMYSNKGLSQRDIAKLIGKSQFYVRTKMKEFNIQSRESGTAQALKRGIPFNEEFFDLWSNEMAYVLGLFYADGDLTNYRFKLELAEKDAQLVRDVANAMKIPYSAIYNKFNKKYLTYSVGFAISRRYTANQLMNLGITSNKSKTMTFPIIPNQFINDFIRGYFDGDGSVCIANKQLCIQFSCGSKEFAYTLANILSEILNHNVKVITDKRCNINYIVRFHSNRLGIQFRDFIYRNSTLFLKRKFNVFNTICQYRALSGGECID